MAGPSGGPWASGPVEILKHALSLLAKDGDTNRRLAIILTDNAVELTMKTYLGLPSRITGIKIGREKFREIGESFPKLLDAMEEHVDPTLLAGVELGQIEWFHRVRNELYHQGNGLTVEREKAEVYAEFAKLLVKNLFGVEIKTQEESQHAELLGRFMQHWQRIDRAVDLMAGRKEVIDAYPLRTLRLMPRDVIGVLAPKALAREFDELRRLRNSIVHGTKDAEVTTELVERTGRVADQLDALAVGGVINS